jgi:hypothetical protein
MDVGPEDPVLVHLIGFPEGANLPSKALFLSSVGFVFEDSVLTDLVALQT